MLKTLKILVPFFLFLMAIACNEKAEYTLEDGSFPTSISVEGDKFIDNSGRQVILNGFNVISKSKDEGYIFQSGPELYSKLAQWGVNCIRLGIIWDGLEPEPGVYNEAYLQEIDQRIKWAEDNNIFVVLDMHQDLYSVKYSDGAPEWATLDEGKPHTTGAIWSDAYVMSEAVQTAFDNFWLNKPVSDGIGVQDHFAALWRHLAKRYAKNKTVIGYDLMNEPFPGSSGIQSTMILLKAFGELYYSIKGEVLSEEQLAQMWGDEASRLEALELISTKENYGFVFNQLNDLVGEFEKNQLQQMYQKVSSAIREVDQKHIIFLEHSYFGNTGVKSGISRVELADGTPDPQVAYAPHGYDLVTDTKSVGSASNERVTYIYDQIKSKGKELNMPVWLGEWGAFYSNAESVVPVAQAAVGLIEDYLFGNAYWSYQNNTAELEYFNQALLRSYPAYINGTLISYKNDFDNKQYKMSWKEDENSKAATMIFIPKFSALSQESIQAVEGAELIQIENSEAGWLAIPALKNGKKRELVLKYN